MEMAYKAHIHTCRLVISLSLLSMFVAYLMMLIRVDRGVLLSFLCSKSVFLKRAALAATLFIRKSVAYTAPAHCVY